MFYFYKIDNQNLIFDITYITIHINFHAYLLIVHLNLDIIQYFEFQHI